MPNSGDPGLAPYQLSGFKYGVLHIRAQRETSLLELLAPHGFSKDFVKEVVDLGGVYKNDVRLKKRDSKRLQANDLIRFHSQPRRFLPSIPDLESRIIF